jgi:DNA-binding NarL/FixJ family response regulator
MAAALSAELPALEVVAMRPDEAQRWQREPLQICVLSAHSPDDAALAKDLGLLAEELPQVPVVVVGDADVPSLVAAAVRHGARGFFPTSGSLRLLVQGIRLVLLGGTALPAVIPAEATPSRAPEAPARIGRRRRGPSWSCSLPARRRYCALLRPEGRTS